MSEIIEINHAYEVFTANPMILLLADIHLGALDNFHPQFLNLMQLLNKKINAQQLPALRAIIISGDFVDVMVESYRKISQDSLNVAVYAEMNKLSSRGIEIIFILGNHEIPVTGKFEKRKKEFLKKFAKQDVDIQAYKAENLAQYIIYQSSPEGPSLIKLFDNLAQLKKESPFRVIPLDSSSRDQTPKKYIFLHGHQFNPWLNAFGGIFFWNFIFKAPEKFKKFLNHLWNKPSENHSQKEKGEMDWRQKFVMKMFNPKKIKAKAEKTNLHFDAVIFGHSHEQLAIEDESPNSQTILIVNTGAWQHVNLPGWAEIGINSEIRNYQMNVMKDQPFL